MSADRGARPARKAQGRAQHSSDGGNLTEVVAMVPDGPYEAQAAKPLPRAELRRLATEYLQPLSRWAHQCHAASMDLVGRAGFEDARVARGTCIGVGGQHSWLVMGEDVYAENALIVDPTLWSYDATVQGVWVGSARDHRHLPFGAGRGTIWDWGRPAPPEKPAVPLAPEAEARLSRRAREFLRMLGPLDRRGWMVLMDAPVLGWPAGEIVAAMDDTPELTALVPIDLLGMLTDRNPAGLYMAAPGTSARHHEEDASG